MELDPSIMPENETSISDTDAMNQMTITVPRIFSQVAPQLLTYLQDYQIRIEYDLIDSMELRITPSAGVIRLTPWHFSHLSVPSLLDQIRRIKPQYQRCFCVVENYYKLFQDPTTTSLISGVLAHLAYKFRLGCIPTRGEADTAHVLRSIVKREQLEDRPPTLARTKPRFDVIADAQCFVVEGLLNCGPKKAHQLLTEFQTPAQIFNAIVNQPALLLNLNGFGPQFLEQNFALLTTAIHSDGVLTPTILLPDFSANGLQSLTEKPKSKSLDMFFQ